MIADEYDEARDEDGVCFICQAEEGEPHYEMDHYYNDCAEEATWD